MVVKFYESSALLDENRGEAIDKILVVLFIVSCRSWRVEVILLMPR